MKSLKLVIILLVVLLIAICGVGAYAYFQTDLFKTPQQLFFKYFDAECNQVNSLNMKPFDSIMNAINNDTAELKLSIPDSDKPTVVATIDSEKNSASAKFEYIVEDSDKPLSVEALVSDDEIGLKIEEIYDKFIVIENRDLKNVAKLFGIEEEALEEIPDNYPKSEKLFAEYNEKSKELTKEYANKFIEMFDAKENFVSQKKVNTQVKSETIKANKYSFVTTRNTFIKNYYEILKQLYKDQRFIDMYTDLYGQNEEALEELNKAFEDMNFETTEEDETFEVALYVANKEIKKASIVIGKTETELYVSNTSLELAGKIVVNEETTANIKFILENTYNDLGGDFTLSYSAEYDIAEGDEAGEDSYFYPSYLNKDIAYMLNIKTTKNGTGYNMEISVGDSLDGEPTKIAEIDFAQGENVKVEKADSSNSVVINDFTEEDLQKLEEEIITNITTNVVENPDSAISKIFSGLFGGLIPEGSIDIDTDMYTDEPITIDTNPQTSIEENSNKDKISREITTGINNCFYDFKMALLNNPEANLLSYLTLENIQKSCYGYTLQLLPDGLTFKCTMEFDLSVYYAKMDLDMENLTTRSVTVYTESEYNNL